MERLQQSTNPDLPVTSQRSIVPVRRNFRDSFALIDGSISKAKSKSQIKKPNQGEAKGSFALQISLSLRS